MALVNLQSEDDPFIAKKWGIGLYEMQGLNAHIFLSELSRQEGAVDMPFFHKAMSMKGGSLGEKFEFLSSSPPDYGVVDCPGQFHEQFGEAFENLDGNFVVSFVEFRRDQQPKSGGWRWHKWGTYFGEQTPTTEYLFDEPSIESIYTFKVFEVK